MNVYFGFVLIFYLGFIACGCLAVALEEALRAHKARRAVIARRKAILVALEARQGRADPAVRDMRRRTHERLVRELERAR